MLRKLIIGALFAVAVQGPVHAATQNKQQSEDMTNEGLQLMSAGQMKAAYDKFAQAAKADPVSSYPLGAMATLYLFLATNPSVSAQDRESARDEAGAAAKQALALNVQDSLAQEVLRRLDGGAERPIYQPKNNAGELVAQGEALFGKKDYTGALVYYQQATVADPLYADAWVFAGDCHYSLRQWAQAETYFRKAAEIDPLHMQAWRFLSDALKEQQKWPELELALAGAIGANPDQQSSWQRMAQFQEHHGVPMTKLDLKIKARGGTGADGKPKIDIQPRAKDAPPAPQDDTFWFGLAMAEAAGALRQAQPGATVSAFEAELAAWTQAMKMLDEMEAKGPLQLQNKAVLAMRKLAADGQLAPALLLLQFKPAYRPDLEAWKTAHPQGVRQFVNTAHVMP